MSVLVFLCFLKRRIADRFRADTGVCPYPSQRLTRCEARSTAPQAPYSVTAFRMPLRMPFSSLPKAFTLSNTPSFMPLAM